MNRSAIVVLLLASALAAQQFEIALPLDALDQKPLGRPTGCTAGDVDGDGRGDLVFTGPLLWLNRGSHFVATPTGVPIDQAAFPPTLLDFDGDGDLDMVDIANTVRLFQNQGTGIFVDVTATHLPPQTFSLGRVYAADIEGDGDLDLLLSFRKVLVNDGNGVFADETATRLPASVPSLSQALAVADFDHDGDVDFVIGEGLHRNDGQGFFHHDPAANITFGCAEHVFTTDLDGDGHTDVVTSAGRFLRNQGNGVFGSQPDLLPAATPPWSVVAVADFDGDGLPDVVLTPEWSLPGVGPVWCANDGAASFPATSFRPLPIAKPQLAVMPAVDLDADGDLDLVATRGWSLAPTVAELLYNDGAGAWHNATDSGGLTTLRTYGRLVADFDGDGDEDLFDTYGIHRNNGAGSFHYAVHGAATYIIPVGGAADLDGDHDLDVVGHTGVLWRNDGSGAFTNGGALLTPPMQARDSAAADIDGDNDLDLVLVTTTDVRIYRNDGGSASTPLSGVLPAGLVATAVTSGDFDGDGDTDLMFGRNVFFGQPTLLFRNDGQGAFTAAPMPASNWPITALRTADMEGDGDLDVIAESQNLAMLLVNGGTGVFTAIALATPPARLQPDDIDGDGDLDLVAPEAFQSPAWLTVHVNDGNNQFTPQPQRVDPARTTDGSPEFVLIDFEGDGDRDLVVIAEDTWTQTQYSIPYVNHQRQLRAAHLTTLGGALEVELATTGAANPAAVAFVCIAAAPAHVDLGALGVLGVDLATGFVDLVVLSAGPAPTVASYSVPLANQLRGVPLYVQGLFVSSTQWRLSGTAVNTIVH